VDPFLGAYDEGSDSAHKFFYMLELYGDVIAIPHASGQKFQHMDWRTHGGTTQRAAEIFSSHGGFDSYNNFSSDIYDPSCLVYHKDLSSQDPPWNGVGPTYKVQWVTEALGVGERFAITGGSDTHIGKPSCEEVPDTSWYPGGMTGVFAQDLTRESVFEAIRAGRCYAANTNARRVVLVVKADGHWMGEDYTASDFPTIQIDTWAKSNIIRVDLLKRIGMRLVKIYEYAPTSSKEAHVSYTDRELLLGQETIYLVRVFVEQDLLTSMGAAWSSPIRVRRDLKDSGTGTHPQEWNPIQTKGGSPSSPVK
jgi:hypothetical protein